MLYRRGLVLPFPSPLTVQVQSAMCRRYVPISLGKVTGHRRAAGTARVRAWTQRSGGAPWGGTVGRQLPLWVTPMAVLVVGRLTTKCRWCLFAVVVDIRMFVWTIS